ncbi:cytochrome C' [Xenophilus aerolatus]|nr:cytochrome C' [Xenophilus aerolatus]
MSLSPPRLVSALVLLLSLAGIATPAAADLALATSKNCMSCHAVDRKVLGPSFKDVAAKYKDNKGAVDLLATKIVKGGSGVWGPVPMPANTQVSEADAKKLAAWVLSTK